MSAESAFRSSSCPASKHSRQCSSAARKASGKGQGYFASSTATRPGNLRGRSALQMARFASSIPRRTTALAPARVNSTVRCTWFAVSRASSNTGTARRATRACASHAFMSTSGIAPSRTTMTSAGHESGRASHRGSVDRNSATHVASGRTSPARVAGSAPMTATLSTSTPWFLHLEETLRTAPCVGTRPESDIPKSACQCGWPHLTRTCCTDATFASRTARWRPEMQAYRAVREGNAGDAREGFRIAWNAGRSHALHWPPPSRDSAAGRRRRSALIAVPVRGPRLCFVLAYD